MIKYSKLIILSIFIFVFSIQNVEARTVTSPRGDVQISTDIYFDHSKTSVLNNTGISGSTNVKLYYVNRTGQMVSRTIYINDNFAHNLLNKPTNVSSTQGTNRVITNFNYSGFHNTFTVYR